MKLSVNDTILEPKKNFRSDVLIISSTVLFYCNVKYRYEYRWVLKKLNKLTLDPVETIDLSSNPSSKYSELQIRENTLMYGLYQVELHVDVFYNETNKLTRFAETFVEIIPMGLIVSATKNSVSQVTIGRRQSFNLEPNVY